jgi:hypothetical protein
MITYDLSCDKGHRFEGWFANREAFEEQLSKALISCPLCESRKIEKRLSAVAVHVARPASAHPSPAQAEPASGAEAGPGAVEGSYLRQLADFVEKNFEDVGSKFAEEAQKMKRGEIESRSIRGSTTGEDEESLREEGIEFTKIALPKYDA